MIITIPSLLNSKGKAKFTFDMSILGLNFPMCTTFIGSWSIMIVFHTTRSQVELLKVSARAGLIHFLFSGNLETFHKKWCFGKLCLPCIVFAPFFLTTFFVITMCKYKEKDINSFQKSLINCCTLVKFDRFGCIHKLQQMFFSHLQNNLFLIFEFSLNFNPEIWYNFFFY